MNNVESLGYFIPELVLTVTVMIVLLADIFGAERKGFDVTGAIALVGTIIAFLAHTSLYGMEPALLFQGMIARDMFSAFFKGFFLLTTAVVVLMTMYSREVVYLKKGEFHSILLSVCVGMCLVASARDLIMIYLALELMSIGSYLLAGFASKPGKTEEAALKYVLYGGVSTAVMLFGISWIYGLTGSTNFAVIQQVLIETGGSVDLAMYIIFIMLFVGVGYKIAAVPFHFWAPDVYEGSPTAVTAFLSVASKGTGFALLIRFFYSTMLYQDDPWVEIGSLTDVWSFHIAILAAITMTVGNLGAINQNNLKRLLAYSGIAHAGYLLMGISVLTTRGLESVIFYLIVYLFTNLVAFLVIVIVVNAQDDDRMSGVRGLWTKAPYTAAIMTVALFSLIGLPPTAGFIGKVYLFVAVLEEEFYWLALIAVLNTVVSLYYYARIIKAMFFENPAEPVESFRIQPVLAVLLIALVIPVLLFGIYWNPLVAYAQQCASMIQL